MIEQEKKFPLAATFGVEADPKLVTVGLEDETHPWIPRKSRYLFRKELLVQVNAFWRRPGNDSLWLYGLKGSGKSSFIEQFCAHLNIPCLKFEGSNDTHYQDLIGCWEMSSDSPDTPPSLKMKYGPLARAMKFGYVLIIDEIDKIPPGQLVGLHDALERKPLYIHATGEKIEPHPRFRLVATANTAGCGDNTNDHPSSLIQEGPSRDRFRFILVDYPSEAEELKILQLEAPLLLEIHHRFLTRLASHIRQVYSGQKQDTKLQGARLTDVLSTRTLIRIASLIQDFRGLENVFPLSLSVGYTNRLPTPEAAYVHQLSEDILTPEVFRKGFRKDQTPGSETTPQKGKKSGEKVA